MRATSKAKEVQEQGSDERRVWYFAYGSNMSPITMRRRRLTPAESLPAVLDDYRLLFDHLGVPFLEPSFANVAPEKGSVVHGVVHHITEGEWKRVLASEGGGGYTEGYFPVEVEVTTYDKRKIKALTLETSRGARHPGETPLTYPSKRYMRLLIGGARHFGIHSDYLTKQLEAQPTNELSFVLWVIALVLLAGIVLPIFVPFYILLRLGMSTRFFHVLSSWIKPGLWRLHHITPALSLSALTLILMIYALLGYLGYSLAVASSRAIGIL